MRKIDVVHLFIYLIIFVVLSNWYINYIIIGISIMINTIIWIIFMKLIIINSKLKKENKKLKLAGNKND